MQIKNAQFMIEANKALAIGAQESAFYALDAFTTGQNPVEYVADLAKKIKAAAKNNDLDTKQIAIQFHKLKTNIVDFGHLTSNEILNLTTKLRKMRVSTDDAVNVFKKFTSLEEATKASAMLFQSFNMNIDAFDLLTSRDPAEMLMQFKNAMQATGRSFESLNRHEKALMQSITGISEQGLSSMMSMLDANMSYEEARKKMDQHDPVKKKTKLIEGLSSSIKQFQKTLQFSSPFDAFFQGLAENALGQKELQGKLINFSKVYESIYNIAFNLKPEEVEVFTKPIVAVLTKIKNIFISGDFLKLTKKVTKTTADFMSDFSINLYSQKDAKNFHLFRLKVNKTIDKLENSQNVAIKAALTRSVESELIYMKNFLDSSEVPDALKNVFKKNKQGIYRIAKGATIDNVLGAITSASENLPNDSKYQSTLRNLRTTLDETYFKEIKSLGATKTMQDAQKHVEKRVSVKGRIDRLYDNLLELFNEGSPLFKQFHDTAGRIMGSLITGAMEGMISLINLFNGGIDRSVSQLGLATESELERQFGKKDVTLLDYLGINVSDVTEIEQGLAEESKRFVEGLPSLMSMAGHLLGDLTQMFSLFASSIIGLIGDFSLSFYEKSDAGTRFAMRFHGFNPVEASRASASTRMKIKKSDSFNDIMNKYNKNIVNKSSSNTVKSGSLITLFSEFKKRYHPDSYAYKFLNSGAAKSVIEKSFNEYSEEGNTANQAYERMSYQDLSFKVHRILAYSKEIDSLLPSSFFEKIDSSNIKNKKSLKDDIIKKSRSNKMNHLLNSAFNNIQSGNFGLYAYNLKDNDEFNSIIDNLRNYIINTNSNVGIDSLLDGYSTKNNNQIEKELDYIFDNLFRDYKFNSYGKLDYIDKKDDNASSYAKKNKVSSYTDDFKKKIEAIEEIEANDFYAKQKNMKVLIGNKIISLDNEDTLVAFKSGGYFDNLFKENNNKIKLLTKENLEVKAVNSNLKKVVQEVENNIEENATEDDLLELFSLFNEVTNMLENREIIVEQPRIVFS